MKELFPPKPLPPFFYFSLFFNFSFFLVIQNLPYVDHHNPPSAVPWQWVALANRNLKQEEKGRWSSGTPVPQNCCMRPELVQGDLGRLQLPNAAPAAHRSSHGQHPAQLLLHSFWGALVSVHLSFADAAKKQIWLLSQPGTTCSR